MCIVASSNVFTLGLQKGLMTDQEKKGDRKKVKKKGDGGIKKQPEYKNDKKKVTEELKNNQSIKMSGR